MGVEAAEALDPSRGMFVGRPPPIWMGQKDFHHVRRSFSTNHGIGQSLVGQKDFLAWMLG
jgi:hypothetical protein